MRTNTGIFKSLNLNATDAEFQNAGFHNSIYREKNITSYLNDGSLWTRISSGKFDDLFIGDYFNVTLNGRTVLMRIAGFDTFLNTGQSTNVVKAHHAVIIPDIGLESTSISNATGGYINSNMHTTILPKWVGYLETALGAAHVLETHERFTDSVDQNVKNCLIPSLTGASNSTNLSTHKAALLSETEVTGRMSLSSSGNENIMVCYGQLPLFRLNPQKIIIVGDSQRAWWLRSIACYPDAGRSGYCIVSSTGLMSNIVGSDRLGVRPRFVIG